MRKASLITLVIIWGLSFIAFINSLFLMDWFKISMAFIALALYFLPLLIKKFFNLEFPAILEIFYYLFVFAALVLGEVFAFYGPFPFWDVILHFLSGFVLAGIGYSIITLSQKSKVTKFIAGLFAVCFSITIGVAWEFTEFTFDRFVKTDAQKDAYVKNIATITMQRDGGNTPVQVNDITTTDIHLTNGEIITVYQGYLDIGLLDTMKDLFVNTAGALLFCAIGALSAEGHHKSKITRHFVLTKK